MGEVPRDFNGPEDSPNIEVIIDYKGEDTSIKLNWSNTLIRLFSFGDGAYDHIIVEVEDEFFSIKPDREFLNILLDLDFPTRVDPFLDEDAIEAISLFEMADGETNNEF